MGGRLFGKNRVGFDGEVVNAQMRRRKSQRLRQIVLQGVQRLAGKGVHQIQIEGRKVAGSFFQRGAGLRGGVHAANGVQRLVVEALYANG